MKNILNRENITLLLSIFGSGYAFFELISKWIRERENYHLNIHEYRILDEKHILMYISVENYSSKNLIIKHLSVCNESNKLDVKCKSEKILTITNKSGSVETSRYDYFSMDVPFTVQANSSISGYIFFQNPLGFVLNSDKHMRLQILAKKLKELEIPLSSYRQK